jgi:hypothetical protein
LVGCLLLAKAKAWKSQTKGTLKSSRSHYKILANLTEICWRCLNMTICYSIQKDETRCICGVHIQSYSKIRELNRFC